MFQRVRLIRLNLKLLFQFKELMLSIDRDENDDDFAPSGALTQGALALTANTTDVDPAEFTEGATVSTSTACPVMVSASRFCSLRLDFVARKPRLMLQMKFQ